MRPVNFEQAGCAICGELTLLLKLKNFKDLDCSLDPLIEPGVTRKEQLSTSDPVQDIEGPVLDGKCTGVCESCETSLMKGIIPKYALANGLWIGDVPPQLQNLTFTEQLLIARVRHNCCLIHVASGRVKMMANVIMFSNPMLKVYHKLPPSKEELDKVLAFIFTGSAQPCDKDFQRTPMLVRRNKVAAALEWLKLNHTDYDNLEISVENLNTYPLYSVPVSVDYRKTSEGSSNKLASAMSVHDMEDEDGTEEGDCSFTVHGLNFTLKVRVKHWGSVKTLFLNPCMIIHKHIPKMFPWLFLYGLGGIGQPRHKNKNSEMKIKKHFLLYHDK